MLKNWKEQLKTGDQPSKRISLGRCSCPECADSLEIFSKRFRKIAWRSFLIGLESESPVELNSEHIISIYLYNAVETYKRNKYDQNTILDQAFLKVYLLNNAKRTEF